MIEAQSPYRRSAAARALGKLGSVEAIDILLGLLNDEYLGVQSEAILAIGDIGGPVALSVIDELIHDKKMKKKHYEYINMARECAREKLKAL